MRVTGTMLFFSFQFTHPGGVRRIVPASDAVPTSFNSRTREGCDCFPRSCRAEGACFNSRTREGCDALLHDDEQRDVCVSIHAPGRGATLASSTITTSSTRFQFTHPGGVRRGL